MKENKVKVFIGKVLEDISYLPILYPNLGLQIKPTHLYIKNVFNKYTNSIFNLDNNIDNVNYILIPHNFYFIKDNKGYIQQYTKLSMEYNKKIIIFYQCDYDDHINIPNSIIIRTSQYRYKLRKNEIIMPPYVEDLSNNIKIKYRNKSKIAKIGFCGFANFNNRIKLMNCHIKDFIINLGKPRFLRRGILLRRKILRELQKSLLIKPNFILRDSFSGHKNTIKLDPKIVRSEYIKNIKDSDLVLCVKGEGNYSMRFYETLSLGRIPILINTNCILPLENIIKYKDFVLFIDYNDINNIDKIVANFYNKISNEEFIIMQRKAREAFEEFLRIDKFFSVIFKEKFLHNFNN